MKYLMLVCQEPKGSAAVQPSAADHRDAPDVEDWWNRANQAGKYVTGGPLESVSQARTVRVREGRRLVTEGAFAELGEYIMGFDLLECDSLEEACEIAAGHPMAYGGLIEVRPLAAM